MDYFHYYKQVKGVVDSKEVTWLGLTLVIFLVSDCTLSVPTEPVVIGWLITGLGFFFVNYIYFYYILVYYIIVYYIIVYYIIVYYIYFIIFIVIEKDLYYYS